MSCDQVPPSAVSCDCEDWQPNVDKLNSIIMLHANRTWVDASKPPCEPFRFCPWCGKELKRG